MAELLNNLLKLKGRIEGLSFYEKGGKIIVRPAHNRKKTKSMTRKQFIMHQRLMHNNALWRKLQDTKQVFFEGDTDACHRFRSINQDVPDVFLTKQLHHNFASLLLPGMVLCDGPFQPIDYQLGEVYGPASSADASDTMPALLTDLTKAGAYKGTLLLYVLKQNIYTQQYIEETPRISITVIPVDPDQPIEIPHIGSVRFVNVPSTLLTPYQNPSGTLALVGDIFADPMLGFGLVRIIDGHASHQCVVTRCTYYERYTTEQSLLVAAKSYGGLTGE